jgi:hypothetical protein
MPRRAFLLLFVAAGALVAACGGGASDTSAERPGSRDAKRQLRVNADGWKTDFSRHSVPLREFSSGGPPRDGIPPLDDPKLVLLDAADEWLSEREPVLAVEVGEHARAYPLQILIWHEIVNDRLGGRAIAVTYCPLCNSSLVFDREVEGVGLLRFGTTGNLRHSDLVMWDDRTESWWQQFTGEAIVGELTGTRLEVLASQTLSWRDFKRITPTATCSPTTPASTASTAPTPTSTTTTLTRTRSYWRASPTGACHPRNGSWRSSTTTARSSYRSRASH